MHLGQAQPFSPTPTKSRPRPLGVRVARTVSRSRRRISTLVLPHQSIAGALSADSGKHQRMSRRYRVRVQNVVDLKRQTRFLDAPDEDSVRRYFGDRGFRVIRIAPTDHRCGKTHTEEKVKRGLSSEQAGSAGLRTRKPTRGSQADRSRSVDLKSRSEKGPRTAARPAIPEPQQELSGPDLVQKGGPGWECASCGVPISYPTAERPILCMKCDSARVPNCRRTPRQGEKYKGQ